MKKYKTTLLFDRHFKSRISKNTLLLKDFRDSVDIFLSEPLLVNDHTLEGKMLGCRSFTVNESYRIIYQRKSGYILFKDIGTHEQVYIR